MEKIRVQGVRKELLNNYKADFEMELSPINVVITPDALIMSEFIYDALKGRCTMYTTKYLTVAVEKCVEPRFYSEELFELMQNEFEKIRQFAKEMNLASEVYEPAYNVPFIKALGIAFNQAPGKYYLVATHPELGVDPIGAFAMAHIAAVATQRLWQKGIELHLIAVTNSLEFIRGAMTKRTNIYIVKRKQVSLAEYLYTAEKWDRRDVIPPFFDSAALAIRRGIID